MKIHGTGKLRRAARCIIYGFAPRALILMYHRVEELSTDPQLLGVTPQHFAEHLEILQTHGHPMRLKQLVQALRDGNIPNRAVAVTFDDGYADNLHNAKPLLERYGIPATVFITTGYIGHKHEFWWDELERLLLQPGTLPETLRLSINGSSCQWELGEEAHYSEDDYRYHRFWNVEQKGDPSQRQHLYRSLYQLLHPLPEGEQRKVLDELLAWAGAQSLCRATHRALSSDEVVQLAEGDLVEVGAHTVTHPVLSSRRAIEQREEIQRSKVHLEEIMGRPVNSFAYPYGSLTEETVAIVRESGFACACSSSADVVWRGNDHYRLPRVVVWDWDGNEFESRLGKWFRG